MSRGLILTVGQQIKNLKFCIEKINPDYLVLIGTNTEECKRSIEELNKIFKFEPIRLKIYDDIEDSPSSIDKIIEKCVEGYQWLVSKGLKNEQVKVDPTGGRKWMSAGLTMIASFLGLNMIYVDVKYRNGKIDDTTMEIKEIGNAYEKTGLLHMRVADKLFNEGNFLAAISMYEFLEGKLSTSRALKEVEIKKKLAEGYYYLTQFNFLKAYKTFNDVYRNIDQIKDIFLNSRNYILSSLKEHLVILEVLKLNDELDEKNNRKYSFFELLKNDNFALNTLKFLYMLQQHYANKGNFEQAVIVLYRILEFISQYRLAKNDIDTDNIKDEVRQKYNEGFKEITKDKDIYKAQKEIPDKIALLDGWILLYCIEDEIVKDQKNINFLKAIKGKTKPRNSLWIEHKNECVNKQQYEDFREFVKGWVKKILQDIENESEKIKFLSFDI